MRVAEAYHPGALTCDATASLSDVAETMIEQHVGALAVHDGNMVIGVISERDITRAVARGADLSESTATDFAAHDLKTAALDEDTLQVARRMLDSGIRHLPVVRDRVVVGVVSMRDLMAVEAWA